MKIREFNKSQLKNEMLDVRPGDTVKIHERISSAGEKKDAGRMQIFEGLVIARKHGRGITATITVRKVTGGIGVEKIFPIHSPVVEKIEIISRGKVRRAKLFYIREAKGRKSRLKRKEFVAHDIEAQAENKKEQLPLKKGGRICLMQIHAAVVKLGIHATLRW
ncbi:MAG: 50S ribosomal protein L19 [Parcubacteria group bacterium GW2011_GWC1_38_6]|nr:MAG: 50S ribosomal protein L19 [Parcubacteria group bacterium GW2011_GWC1_38_6]